MIKIDFTRTNTGPYMEWHRKQKCIIDGKKIIPQEEGDIYNPFDDPKLYLSFLAVDETTPDGILYFVNKFGLLREPMIFRIKSVHQKLPDFVTEVKRFRCVVGLGDAINDRDLERIKLLVADIWKLDPAFKDFGQPVSIGEELIQTGIDVLRYYCQGYLNEVTPVIMWAKGNKIKTTWRAKNLISAMYAQFFSDMNKGITTRQCRSKTCDQYFRIQGDYDKLYCDADCARREAQREYKKRKRVILKLLKEGKPIEDIFNITGYDKEIIQNLINKGVK